MNENNQTILKRFKFDIEIGRFEFVLKNYGWREATFYTDYDDHLLILKFVVMLNELGYEDYSHKKSYTIQKDMKRTVTVMYNNTHQRPFLYDIGGSIIPDEGRIYHYRIPEYVREYQIKNIKGEFENEKN